MFSHILMSRHKIFCLQGSCPFPFRELTHKGGASYLPSYSLLPGSLLNVCDPCISKLLDFLLSPIFRNGKNSLYKGTCLGNVPGDKALQPPFNKLRQALKLNVCDPMWRQG